MAARNKSESGKGSLFWLVLPLCALVAIWGIISPEGLAWVATTFTRTAFQSLDWLVMGSTTAFAVLCLWLAFGPYGRMKLGRDEDEPEFSTASWVSMLFAAGMGVGLLFWGVAEPITHFASPPIGEAGTPEAARQSLVLVSFHWGLHAWAVYGIGALILAYFGFRHGKPYLAGAPIRAAFRGKWVGPVATLSDLIAVLAVAFGVAGSLGMGTLQIQSGLHIVLGAPEASIAMSMGILAVIVAGSLASATTSLDKGIKWLSNLNMVLALLLLVFVLIAGPTGFLLSTFATTVSDYASNVVGLSLRLFPFSEIDDWLESWTLTYLIWWIAWAPFVGIFIARISRGRTIRQFVVGVLLAPTAISMLWFTVFGGTALHEELRGEGGIVTAVQENVTGALFTLYEGLPLSPLLGGITLVLLFVFVVTSVDSATYVLGMLTSRGALVPPRSRKIAWGLSLGVLGAALIFTDNIEAIKAAAVAGAVPFTFILLLQVAALLKTLREEGAAALAPTSGSEGSEPTSEEDRS